MTHNTKCRSCCCQRDEEPNRLRRNLLKIGPLIGLASPATTFASRKPEKMRPQMGDRLVFAYGERQGEIIRSDDVVLGAAPIAAFPKDTLYDIVRDRSRLNQLLLLRLESDELAENMAPYHLDGVVAYSAVCTHTGCTVEGWDGERKRIICPCHGSEYDVTRAAAVLLGPAPKPLAMLPLTLDAGTFVVAGNFSRKVGFKK